MPRIGLLFGSFNPVHTGHLVVAEHFADLPDLAEVWLVVSPHNPFKAPTDLLPEAARLHLVALAVAGNPRLRVCAVEFDLPRPSYTSVTLDVLRRQHPGTEFVLLVGADNLPGLPRWHDAARLLAETDLYAYPRPGTPPLTPAQAAPLLRLTRVDAPLLDISATYLRQRLRQGHSIRYLVPDAVAAEIARARHFLVDDGPKKSSFSQ